MMPRSRNIVRFAIVLLLLAAPAARAYVDLAPTLAKLLRESQTVALLQVDKLGRDNNAVILTKVKDLKGTAPAEPIRHQVAAPGMPMPRPVLEWAQPGQRAIAFISPLTTVVCIGQSWYQVTTPSDGWWRPAAARPELPLAYCGTISRLAQSIEQMLAGKDAIITTLAHGADDLGASFDIALNRTSLPGLIKLQRTRANLRMPGWVISVQAKPHYMIGPGPADDSDIPDLIRALSSPDPSARAEAADDLRWLGPRARTAAGALSRLLEDRDVQVRCSAAGALLRIGADQDRALEALEAGLSSPDARQRRDAARVAGLAGSAAKPLVGRLISLLFDEDELTRHEALEAVATLGPEAADARAAVDKMLDEPAFTITAADALGRMGPAARPSMKRLAKLIESGQPALQWAGVRAMSQIGGPDSAPAVAFMIQQLKSFSEVDGYNMMVYLCLLGPDARAAKESIEQVRVKNRALRLAALWTIDPETRFPWIDSDRVMSFFRDADWQRFIFDALYVETGDRFRPAARILAQKIMDGAAGDIPSWGYKLLAHFPDEAIDTFRKGLADPGLVMRQRATVALGFMGPAARDAQPQLAAAIEKAPTEREQRLLKWALKQVTKSY